MRGVWNVEPVLSRVGFEAAGKWGATKVLGRFDRFTGSLVVQAYWVEADLSVDAASLTTKTINVMTTYARRRSSRSRVTPTSALGPTASFAAGLV
jgi:polyisoprenoid-binding protein YceI